MSNFDMRTSNSVSYSPANPSSCKELMFDPEAVSAGGAGANADKYHYRLSCDSASDDTAFASACERIQAALLWFMETVAGRSSTGAQGEELAPAVVRVPAMTRRPEQRRCIPDRLDQVAANLNTPLDVLERLTHHPEPEVRVAVAENKNVPLRCLWTLAHDRDPDVRYQLAENHQLPVRVLLVLAEDGNPYVACRARATLTRLLKI